MEKDSQHIKRLEKEIEQLKIELVEAKEDLSLSEQKCSSLVDKSPSGIMIIGDKFIIEYVNIEITKILRCKEDEVLGSDFIKLVAEVDKPMLEKRYADRRKGHSVPDRYEFRVKAFDGSIRYLELSSSIIASLAGAKKTIAQVIDITERKIAEKALKDSEERYRTLVENSPDGITFADLEGKLISVNQRILDMHGYSSFEDLKKDKENVFSFIAEEERELAHQNAAKVFDKGVANNLIYNVLRKDGSTFPAELSSTLIKDTDGNPVGFMALTRDISDRTKAEQEIKETSEHLANIFRAANDGMWDWDLASGRVFFDPRYYEMAGYEVDEFPYELAEFQSRVHPEDIDQVMKNASDHLEGKSDRFLVEFRFRKKNNDWMWIMGRGIVVDKDKDGKPLRLMGTHTDISVNKNLLFDLQKEKERAEESDRLKSAFLANMSHEIRTPMNGILGFADLLSHEDLTEEQKDEYVKIIRKSGQRMLNTINDIIDISKIESGQSEITVSETNINDQFDYLYEFFLPEAGVKGLKIIFRKPLKDEDVIINTDKEKLIAIISNLIKNAIKYSHSGIIEIGYKKKKDTMEFYVRDEGIGISEDRQKAIFDRFVQADLTITKAYEGSGLGLAISKGFIDLLGGEIWVESSLGEGSLFRFTIPCNSLAEKTSDSPKAIIDKDNKQFKDLTILIVEDDESAYFYLKEVIKRYCKKILRAETGTEAVELCKKHEDLSLVLMDIKMPEMDGFEATRQIRKFNKTLPIIGQTAYAMVGDRQKVKDSGCNDYISKPIDKGRLYEILLKYV